MRFKDENCGNCLFFCTKEEIYEIFKVDINAQEKINNHLDLNDDDGGRCVRYPEIIDTGAGLWCGEWKRKTEAK